MVVVAYAEEASNRDLDSSESKKKGYGGRGGMNTDFIWKNKVELSLDAVILTIENI